MSTGRVGVGDETVINIHAAVESIGAAAGGVQARASRAGLEPMFDEGVVHLHVEPTGTRRGAVEQLLEKVDKGLAE